MTNAYPFPAESALAMDAAITGVDVEDTCPVCGGTGTRQGIAVRPRTFPGCTRPRLPEAILQPMVCGTCRGRGTVWSGI